MPREARYTDDGDVLVGDVIVGAHDRADDGDDKYRWKQAVEQVLVDAGHYPTGSWVRDTGDEEKGSEPATWFHIALDDAT